MAFNPAELQSGARAWRGALMVSDVGMALLSSKKYRMYREFTANTTLQFVITKPFLLTDQRLWTGQGNVRLSITTGSTPSGTFTAIPTQFCLNTKDTLPVPAGVISAGGTVTGGTERDVLRSYSGNGGGVGVGSAIGSSRLLQAGTYYFTLVVEGTTTGMYSFEWEELE